jgi:hypothetical protein
MYEQIMNSIPSCFKNINILYDDIKNVDYCNTSSHDYCKHILNLIEYYIKKNENFPEKLIERFIKVICESIECWSLNYDDNLKKAKNIFKQNKLSDNVQKRILKIQNSEIYEIFLNNCEINDDVLETILDNNYFYNITYDFIMKNNKEKYIYKLLDYSIKNYDGDIITKLLDNKFNISNDMFIKIIVCSFRVKDGLELIKKCITNGAKIEKNTLSLVINNFITDYTNHVNNDRYYYYDVKFLNKNKYDTNNSEEIFIFLFENGSTDINFTELNMVRPYINFQYFINILNYFIENGMNITIDNFITICNLKIKINNIKNITQFFKDENVVNAIYENNLKYPIEVKHTYEMLKLEVNRRNLPKIKEITQTIKPTQEILELACKTNSIQIIKYLHEICEIKFNEQCILNSTLHLRHSTLLNYLVNQYKNNKTNKIDKIDNNIVENESESSISID